MSHVLIDGYNLLAQSNFSSREELLSQLKNYTKSNNHKITIFFDGTHQGTGTGDKYYEEYIEIIFSPLTVTADDMMEEYIEKHHQPNVIVVSSDRRIQKAATAKRLAYLESKEFLFKLKYVPSTAQTKAMSMPWMEGRTTDEEHPRKPKKGNAQKKSKKERQKKRSTKKL